MHDYFTRVEIELGSSIMTFIYTGKKNTCVGLIIHFIIKHDNLRDVGNLIIQRSKREFNLKIFTTHSSYVFRPPFFLIL